MDGQLSLDFPEKFPQGFGGIYAGWFQRQFPDLEQYRKVVRPALRANLAAQEPLPVEILQQLFEWQNEVFRDFIRSLGSLFTVMKAPRIVDTAKCDGGHGWMGSIYRQRFKHIDVIRPCHMSLTDWLSNDSLSGPYYVSVSEGHRTLGDFCIHHMDCEDSFAISEVVYHTRFHNDPRNLFKVFLTPSYFARRRRTSGLDKLFEDLSVLATRSIDHRIEGSLDGLQPEVKVIFAIVAFHPESPGYNGMPVLHRFAKGSCGFEELERACESLQSSIREAGLKPRSTTPTAQYCSAR